AKGITPALARQLRREVRVNDRARVDGGDHRAEDVFAFEEEGALLFEEDWKALIGCADGRVRFDLREVWIDGKVERDGRRQSVFSCQAQVGLDGFVGEMSRIKRIKTGVASRIKLCVAERAHAPARLRNREARNQLKRALGRDAFKPRQMRFLIERA